MIRKNKGHRAKKKARGLSRKGKTRTRGWEWGDDKWKAPALYYRSTGKLPPQPPEAA